MRKPELKLHQKALIAGLACASTLPVSTALAGTDSGRSYGTTIIDIEVAKREDRVRQAYEAEAEGDRLFAKQDFAGAIERYQFALNTLPNGYKNQRDRHRIISKYSKACIIHARELGHRGDFAKAKSLLNSVLSDTVDPDNREAQVLLHQLDDPDRFNQAMTTTHYAHTEEVKRHFDLALGYYDLGQFKEAEDEFNRILAIDPYNTAARRGLERTERQITNYLKSGRDEQRLRMLNQVDSLWVNAVPGTLKVPINTTGTPGLEDPGSAPVSFKLNNIIIDHIQFAEADLNEVVTYLRRKSAENDPTETDPNKKGVNFINNVKDGAKPVSIDLRNVKLIEALKAATDFAGVRFDVQPNAVVIIPQGVGPGSMTIRTYRVPPDFLTRGTAAAAGGEAAAPADPFASGGDKAAADTGPKLKGKPSAKEVLQSLGVTFTEGAFASFDATSGRLVVKNSYDQLDLVETVVEDMGKTAVKQVYITTKFVEVTQRNNEELGFDWLLGAFNIGGQKVFGAGGTSGNAGPIDSGDFSVITPTGAPVGGNPITRGLRFGADAISRNAIDALIAGGTSAGGTTSAVTPAAFAIAGVFTDPQFQVMMRALSQKKGVDLMTAPSIIVRGGQRSKIEVIREFPYPTEFDPPQIPQTFGGGGSLFGNGAGTGSSFPVTPTTPSSFTFRNTGVTMEVEATVGEDGYTIDLNLAPEVVEFEGFINYGSPIQTTGINALGQTQPVVLTDNKILQPVFATRKLATQVLIWDRQTVGIGGLIREDVQSVEDKVPIVSAIPLIGRLFKTKNEEHYKKNLMIYVTAQLIDPAGQPVHGNDIPATVEEKVEENLFPPGMQVDSGKGVVPSK